MLSQYAIGFLAKCAEMGVSVNDAGPLLKTAQALNSQRVSRMYPRASAERNGAARAVADAQTGGGTGGVDARSAVLRDNLMASGLSPEELSALHLYGSASDPSFHRSGTNSVDVAPGNVGYEFMRDPRYMNGPSVALTPEGTNLLESVAPGGKVDWDAVDSVTGRRQGWLGRDLPLPVGFMRRKPSLQDADVNRAMSREARKAMGRKWLEHYRRVNAPKVPVYGR